MRKLVVEIEIEVVELPEDEKAEAIAQIGDYIEADEPDYFNPQNYAADEFDEVIEQAFHEDAVREAFAGSNMFVTFGDVKVTKSSWEG